MFKYRVQEAQKKIKLLEDSEGSLEITEFDDKNGQYTYRPYEYASAADVEQWFLNIPPKLIKVSPSGFPKAVVPYTDVDSRLMNQWNRTVYDLEESLQGIMTS